MAAMMTSEAALIARYFGVASASSAPVAAAKAKRTAVSPSSLAAKTAAVEAEHAAGSPPPAVRTLLALANEPLPCERTGCTYPDVSPMHMYSKRVHNAAPEARVAVAARSAQRRGSM
uniref:Uncharacterized protein n=1 Tax=Chlamydomonas euryale TaxID=1486919 RepID=A0A7R9VN53_9CHLO|mmetsp:Transcript_39396/g.117188  ORF Transcript_39396/g.117188 Transcript_39396/m.117188 type:complete len:117 (+) Transcript_39396:142-492(+)